MVSWLSYWSLAWTVMVEVPRSTLTVVGDAVIVVIAGSAAPGVKVTWGSPVEIDVPFIVPLIVSTSAWVSMIVAV